jgi:hypothetical protein
MTNATIVTNITSIVAEAQAEIRVLIDGDINLAPKFLRLAFHDAVSLNCLDISNPDNLGLQYPIAALNPVVAHYKGLLSQADIWVMAAGVACEVTSGGWKFPMYYYGRGGAGVEVDECQNVTPLDFPSPDLTTHTLLQYFRETFGFNTRETVVVMGAHTIGSFTRRHSGFHNKSGWVDGRQVLDHEYYRVLVGGIPSSSRLTKLDDAPFWEKLYLVNEGMKSPLNTSIPNRFMWTRRGDAAEDSGNDEIPIIMTNADMALVRDLASELNSDGSGRVLCDFSLNDEVRSLHGRCPAADLTIDLISDFKYNNTLWLVEFERVLGKMFTYGYDLQRSSEGDDTFCPDDSKCLTLVDPNVFPVETLMPSSSPTEAVRMVPTAMPQAVSAASSMPLLSSMTIIVVCCAVALLQTVTAPKARVR